jgi:hypothetical protein
MARTLSVGGEIEGEVEKRSLIVLCFVYGALLRRNGAKWLGRNINCAYSKCLSEAK